MLLRLEPWGGWASLETEAAIVALDRDGVRALGVDGERVWSSAAPRVSMPLEVHVAVTSKCAAGCEGCYLDARADGEHVPLDVLKARLDAIADAGVFTVAFGGGEPTSRADLDELARHAKARGLRPVLTTSGLGLSPEKVSRLTELAQVNVSYDGAGEAYESVRGFDGAAQAERAIALLTAAGVRVGVNVVLTQATFGSLSTTLDRARSLGASEAQLLRYKPQGRALGLDYLSKRLSLAQRLAFPAELRRLSIAMAPANFRLRIDCALVPFLSSDPEITGSARSLSRMGVLGCEAGGALAAARVDGKLAPCSFAEPAGSNAVDLSRDYGSDAVLARYRTFADAPPEPCASCELRTVCKGGCKVVSQFEGHFGPDPECPRVALAGQTTQPTV